MRKLADILKKRKRRKVPDKTMRVVKGIEEIAEATGYPVAEICGAVERVATFHFDGNAVARIRGIEKLLPTNKRIRVIRFKSKCGKAQ